MSVVRRSFTNAIGVSGDSGQAGRSGPTRRSGPAGRLAWLAWLALVLRAPLAGAQSPPVVAPTASADPGAPPAPPSAPPADPSAPPDPTGATPSDPTPPDPTPPATEPPPSDEPPRPPVVMPPIGHPDSPYFQRHTGHRLPPANASSAGGTGLRPWAVASWPQPRPKKWEVVASIENHILTRQDVGGSGADKFFFYLSAQGRYFPTRHDRLDLRWSVYDRHVKDQGETGVRTDDLTAQYTRFIPLPDNFRLTPQLAVSAPTSFVSHLQGTILAGRLTVSLERPFGDYVYAAVRVFHDEMWQSYDAAPGGSPNPRARLAGALEVEVSMPFYPRLSVGTSLYDGYAWYYTPAGRPVGDSRKLGATDQANYATTSGQQTYGGEVYVRFTFPRIEGAYNDLQLSFAQGDPTLGYTSRLHDGGSHLYLFYRKSSEVYWAYTVRY